MKIMKIHLMMILMAIGIIFLMLSYFYQPVLTPSEWVDQVNGPEEVNPPAAERFKDFNPGDTVYIEGEINYAQYLSQNDRTVFGITDGKETCYFATEKNFSNLAINDYVFFKIEIIETRGSDGSFILSGNDPYYFKEEAVLVDIEKEHFPYKLILFSCGITAIIIGLIIAFTLIVSKNNTNFKKSEKELEKDSSQIQKAHK